MRLSVTYDVSSVQGLPLDYRGGFVALFISALENNSINHTTDQSCQDIYQSGRLCFAIRFDRRPTIEDQGIYQAVLSDHQPDLLDRVVQERMDFQLE